MNITVNTPLPPQKKPVWLTSQYVLYYEGGYFNINIVFIFMNSQTVEAPVNSEKSNASAEILSYKKIALIFKPSF
jgi:hypothetical protein